MTGVGRCPLVLLPGLDGTGELFTPFVQALNPQLEVVIVRYPKDERLGYTELQRIADAALPVGRPCVVLGESFSGPIAISLAAARPEQVKGLVLCCTFVSDPSPWLTRLHPLLGLLPEGRIPPMPMLEWALLGRFASPDLRALMDRVLRTVPPRTLQARLRAVRAVDASAPLCAVTAPILSLQALQDRLVPASSARRIAQLRPDVRTVCMDAPHGLLQAVPTEAAAVVGEFVEAQGHLELLPTSCR